MKWSAFLGAIALTMLGSGQVFGHHSSIQEMQLDRETCSPTPNLVVDNLPHTRHPGTKFKKRSTNDDPIIYENKPSVILEERRVNKPVAKAGPKPGAKAAGKPAAKQAGKLTAKPAGKLTAKPAAKSGSKATKPAAKARRKPAAKQVAKQAAKQAVKPIAKPVAKLGSKAKARGKQAAKPAAKQAAKPGSKATKPGAKARGKTAAKATKPGAKARGKPAAKQAAKPRTKSPKSGAKARGKLAVKPGSKATKPGATARGKSNKSRVKSTGKANQLAKGRKSQQTDKTSKATKSAHGRQSGEALHSKTRKSGQSAKPPKSRKPGNSKKQNSKAGSISKPQHKTSKSGSSPKHDKVSNRGKGQKQALKTGKKKVKPNRPGRTNKPIGLIKPAGPPKSANLKLGKGSHHNEKASKTTKARKKEQTSKKDKHSKPQKSSTKSAKSKPTKSGTQKFSTPEKSKPSGPGRSNNHKLANAKPTRPRNGKLPKESKLTSFKSGKQTDPKVGKSNNPNHTKKQSGKGNAPKSVKGKLEKNNQGKLAKQVKNNALTLSRGKPPKSRKGNVVNTGKQKTSRPTQGSLRGQGTSRNLQSSVTPGKKGPEGQGKSKQASAGGSCLLSRGVSGQAGGSCSAKKKEEKERPVKPESFDPFDENEEGKQFRYQFKPQTEQILHADKVFDKSDVHREQFGDKGESLGPGNLITQIGFTEDGKEAVIPWAFNKHDLPRDKEGKIKAENDRAEGEPTPSTKGKMKIAKEFFSKLKPKKSDQAPKDSANKYDKASLADLVNAVSKKTGKDPSKLENVHIKDIIEKDTEDRIKEVKKGRENEEIVLYPNQESKDFEKIHDSEWGKSVQRIGKNIGNKEIESITIPPLTEVHPHLNFKLADRPATEPKSSATEPKSSATEPKSSVSKLSRLKNLFNRN